MTPEIHDATIEALADRNVGAKGVLKKIAEQRPDLLDAFREQNIVGAAIFNLARQCNHDIGQIALALGLSAEAAVLSDVA